jgi:hypothetical protein
MKFSFQHNKPVTIDQDFPLPYRVLKEFGPDSENKKISVAVSQFLIGEI